MSRPFPYRSVLLAACCLVGLLGLGCRGDASSEPQAPTGDVKTSDAPDERPNVLLISIDTLRADHMSLYGYGRETTPRLDAFAQASTYFDIAYSTTSTTGPSHATLLTGLQPVDHGIRKNAMMLDDALTTLPEVFQERSYRTGAVVSSFVLHQRFGWKQGFDHFEDEFNLAGSKMPASSYQGFEVPDGFDRRGAVTTEMAIDWIEAGRSENHDADVERKPFFLLLHYFDPHEPYAAPAPFAELFPVPPEAGPIASDEAAYDREIAYLDHQLGDLFDYLDESGLADDTLVIVTADHGQGLMQYGYPSHGIQLYEGQVRVPMILRWPGMIPPRHIEAAGVSWLDVAPTILGLSGVEKASLGSEGRDLSRVLLSGRDPDQQLDEEHPIPLYRQHYKEQQRHGIHLLGEQFGLVQGSWKLIFAPDERRVELYQLDEDPGERRNLAAMHPDQVERMLAILQPTIDQKAPLDMDLVLSDEEREALEALGYTE